MPSRTFKRALIVLFLLTTKQGVAAHSHHDHDHSHDAHGHRRLNQFSCGTGPDPNPAEAQRAVDEWLALHPCSQESCPFVEEIAEATVQIDVVWHNIQKDDGSEGSTTTMISDAMKVLNGAFASAGFSFSLVNTIETRSTLYWGATTVDELIAMMTALHTGDCSRLNVFSNSIKTPLGYAFGPSSCADFPNSDGAVIHYQTSPGGTITNLNQGGMLIHGTLCSMIVY